jgi:hypothetical protein
MVHEPVFEDPNSLISLLQRAEARRRAGDRIPDAELAKIIEHHRGKALPAVITEYLIQHFHGQIKSSKGPKLQSDADKDFRFGPAHNLYRRALPIFEYLEKRRKRLPKKRRVTASTLISQNERRTPGERALDHALTKSKDECDLRTVSRRSLANAMSQRQRKIEELELPDDGPNAHPSD